MAKLWMEFAFVAAVAICAYSYLNKTDRESIRGKKVLVTGSSQNIGEEIAYQYAKLGAKIVVTARREAALKKVAEKCKALGASKASYLVADMSETGVHESVIENAVKILGGLDILVLNHVVSRHARWNGTDEDFEFLEQSISVNYFSYVRLATAAMPHLKETKGQLMVVASQAGRPGLPNIAAYGASKSAIINFFTSLQLERMMLEEQAYPTITTAILGAIETDQARWLLTKEKMQIQGYPVADTVSIMIDGAINGRKYVYAPPYIRFLALGRELNPDLFDRLVLYFVYGK